MTKINWKSLIPAGIAVASYLLSPDFYNVLPEHQAHLMAMIATGVGVAFPTLLKKG